MPRLSVRASFSFQVPYRTGQSERTDSVSIGAGDLAGRIRLVQTVLEFFLRPAQVLGELGKLRTAEEHENENKENDALWATECKSDHPARLPHGGIDGAARATRPKQAPNEQAS